MCRPEQKRRSCLQPKTQSSLLAGAGTEEDIAGPGGLLAQPTKPQWNGQMEVEMSNRLGTSRIRNYSSVLEHAHRSTEDARYRARAGTDARPEGSQLISRVTDAVMDDVRPGSRRRTRGRASSTRWCSRLVTTAASSAAPAISRSGSRWTVTGMRFQETGGAKFWMQVLSELRQFGARDIIICCVDRLKMFAEAIEAIYPTQRSGRASRT